MSYECFNMTIIRTPIRGWYLDSFICTEPIQSPPPQIAPPIKR